MERDLIDRTELVAEITSHSLKTGRLSPIDITDAIRNAPSVETVELSTLTLYDAVGAYIQGVCSWNVVEEAYGREKWLKNRGTVLGG
jgi:hypothetical protein